MAQAIKPQELSLLIPDFVIEGVNKLLQENFNGNKTSIVLTQTEVVKRILDFAPEGVTKEDLFKKFYMNFEKAYIEAGWEVIYDRPGYNETYEPTFKFTPKKD